MNDGPKEDRPDRTNGFGPAAGHVSVAWLVLSGSAAAAVFCSLAARLYAGPRFDGLLIASAAVAGMSAGLFAALVAVRNSAPHAPDPQAPQHVSAQPIPGAGFKSAGPMLTTIGGRYPSVTSLSKGYGGSRASEPMPMERTCDHESRWPQVLIDSIADGICGLDREGCIVFANPAFTRLLTADASTLVGRPIHEVLHGAGTRSTCGENCPLRLAAGHRAAFEGEDRLLRMDGSSFPAEYCFSPVPDDPLCSSVLSFRDISRRSALEREKDEFVSTVSHELRTPLTSIRGALGLLSSGILGDVNEKANSLLRIALSNSDRLVRLINDILDLERIESGREPLNFRSVHLADVVRQAIDGMAPVAESAGVHLIHDTTKVEIAGDPDRLLQVLTNLLSNAIKFSPADSTVSVIMRRGADGVTLSVIDQGRGIPAEKLETIFGRFQQVEVSDARQKGGSGLGLAICRTIVMQHCGRIWAERNPLRGATFRVFLPYAQAAAHSGPQQALAENAQTLLETLPQIAGR